MVGANHNLQILRCNWSNWRGERRPCHTLHRASPSAPPRL